MQHLTQFRYHSISKHNQQTCSLWLIIKQYPVMVPLKIKGGLNRLYPASPKYMLCWQNHWTYLRFSQTQYPINLKNNLKLIRKAQTKNKLVSLLYLVCIPSMQTDNLLSPDSSRPGLDWFHQLLVPTGLCRLVPAATGSNWST